MDKKWYFSKSIWLQVLGLIGMILIAGGVVGEANWAMYCGVATQVLGIAIRLITKGEIVWS